MNQEGSYVTIPGGSNYYLYGNGEDINGWTYPQFAAVIGSVIDELPEEAFGEQSREEIHEGFSTYFGGWNAEYRGGISTPERAEIFCQCVDRRIESLELTNELQYYVQEWADDFEAMRECDFCGNEIRPYIYNEDSDYVCDSSECETKHQAEQYGITLKESRRAERIEDEIGFDEGWEYIVNHSTRDDL